MLLIISYLYLNSILFEINEQRNQKKDFKNF